MYKNWIKKFEKDDSPIGDLAREINYDKMFPTSNNKSYILNYLQNHSACDEAIEAFTQSWDLFMKDNS